jgi:hypothetical protein
MDTRDTFQWRWRGTFELCYQRISTYGNSWEGIDKHSERSTARWPSQQKSVDTAREATVTPNSTCYAFSIGVAVWCHHGNRGWHGVPQERATPWALMGGPPHSLASQPGPQPTGLPFGCVRPRSSLVIVGRRLHMPPPDVPGRSIRRCRRHSPAP